MTETINGLHKCQEKNTPHAGETKNLVVLHMPAKGTKKPWIKIKSEALDKGGSPYRIVSVTPTGWEPDDYGNVSFNLEVEAVNGGIPKAEQEADAERMFPTKPKQAETLPIMSKDDYWRRKEEGDAERQRFIIRQHSQSMALEVLKLKVTLNQLTIEDLTPAKISSLATFFDNDVIGAAQ